MDLVTLSRIQFATTTVYHFFFVPLTLGLSWCIVIFEVLYVRTGQELYKKLALFWGKLFLINFATGVVTGIVLEFQFGMNWSEYARYVGDIFGAPLAIEALLTFFLESTFLGIWIFGWDRLSKNAHAASIVLVAIGSTLSAFWILTANGFMQHPVGFVLRNGRAEMVDFLALITNPRALYFFGHTISSGFATAAFFILSISAYHLLRKQEQAAFQASFRIASLLALLSTFAVIVVGHTQGLYIREVQPMAAAASEALWDTDDPAPFSPVALFDSTGKKEIWSIKIPNGLSFLYYFQPWGEVQGIHQLQAEYSERYGPGDYVPLVALDFWTFRIMVSIGFLMFALSALACFLAWRKWSLRQLAWLHVIAWIFPLPYIANTAGWILTENGRQPWIVHGLLKTDQAVSPNLTPQLLWASLAGFAFVYAILILIDAYLLIRTARRGIRLGDSSGISFFADEQPQDDGAHI